MKSKQTEFFKKPLPLDVIPVSSDNYNTIGYEGIHGCPLIWIGDMTTQSESGQFFQYYSNSGFKDKKGDVWKVINYTPFESAFLNTTTKEVVRFKK